MLRPDPSPRIRPAQYEPFTWPDGDKLLLSPRKHSLELNLVELLEQRQTRREFSSPFDNVVLGEFLWLACRNRSSSSSPFGIDQESRVYPSAGAMHPVHVLVCRKRGPWMRYDPVGHLLIELPTSFNSASLNWDAASDLLELGQGVLVGLVAEPGKTAAKYEDYETLVWRDAGVVLGYMSLIAEALNLSFCPLGITGQPFLTDYLCRASTLQAVGMAALGKG